MKALVKEVTRMHAHICQAFADPKRILIIYALGERPRNVGELAELYDFAQPTVSRHLKFLRERSLVVAEREGNTVTYSLTDPRVIQALDIMRAVMADILKHNAKLAEQLGA